MSGTLVSDTDASRLVKKFWSDIFVPELREAAVLPALVNKDYEGEITKAGDTVKVSMINAPAATNKKVGEGHETFETSGLQSGQVELVADRVITAAYEFDNLSQLQSQIGDKDSEIRQGLLFAVLKKINDHLYSLVSPSTSAPDHSVASVTDMNAAAVLANRTLASTAKWPLNKGWYALLDPSYYSNALNSAVLTSRDYVDDLPVVGGQIVAKRFGFGILEDNSEGLSTMAPGTLTVSKGLFFHPDFMLFAMQQVPTFQVSSQHSNKRLGYIVSCSLVCGAKLGPDGSKKHIINYNS